MRFEPDEGSGHSDLYGVHEVGEEVSLLVFGQSLQLVIGHDREWRRGFGFDFGQLDDVGIRGDLDGQRAVVAGADDAAQDAPVFQSDDRDAIVRRDLGTRVDDVLQQVVEDPAVRSCFSFRQPEQQNLCWTVLRSSVDWHSSPAWLGWC